MRSLVFLGCLLVASSPNLVQAQGGRTYDDRHKISVTGEATVYAVPDKFVLQFGVETQDKVMTVAKEKNGEIMRKALAAIKEAGISAGDVRTNYLHAEPRWEQRGYGKAYQQTIAQTVQAPSSSDDGSEAGRRFRGFFVRSDVAVTIKDAAKIDKLIADLLAAGVNYIDRIDFQTSELKKHREEARERALRAAKEKAEKMAAVLGQAIGPPLDISEGGGPVYNYAAQNEWAAAEAAADAAGGTTTIALGKMPIRATVAVTFELHNK